MISISAKAKSVALLAAVISGLALIPIQAAEAQHYRHHYKLHRTMGDQYRDSDRSRHNSDSDSLNLGNYW